MKIAIIPARAGSKRLTQKNILDLCGKPLIAWTIEAALASGLFDQIYVSTDSVEIAEVATKYCADVPFLRPPSLASDTADIKDVVIHLMNWHSAQGFESLSHIMILQPTSPLRNSRDIRDAWEFFVEKNADAVVSVCKLEHPLELCNQLDDNLCMNGFLRMNTPQRSQDMQSYYRINGAIYMMKPHMVELMGPSLYGRNTFAFKMNNSHSVDIDVIEDFHLAEYLIENEMCD